jgi:hypothetical protein
VAAKTSISVQQSTLQNPFEIHFTRSRPGVLAVPPDPEIPAGHHVVFVNDTPGRIEIFMASDNVLDDLKEIKRFRVNANGGRSRPLEVHDNPGDHEYVAHFKFRDSSSNKWQKGFAIGNSSPRIRIVDPP